MGLTLCILAYQIQNFLTQGGTAPLQHPPGEQPPGPGKRSLRLSPMKISKTYDPNFN